MYEFTGILDHCRKALHYLGDKQPQHEHRVLIHPQGLLEILAGVLVSALCQYV